MLETVWEKVDLDKEYRERIIAAHNRASLKCGEVDGKNWKISKPERFHRVNQNGIAQEYEKSLVTDLTKNRTYRVVKPLFDKDVVHARGEKFYEIEEKIEEEK